MSSKNQILKLLSDGKFHSGEIIGQELNISRAAVCKAIKSLRELGLNIHAVSGKGYRISEKIELLDKNKLIKSLIDLNPAKTYQIEIFQTINSTNSYLLANARNNINSASIVNVCLAESQLAGRGRRGKQWISPFGQSISLSISQFLDCEPAQLTGLSIAVGVVVAKVIEKIIDKHHRIKVKWPNDIYVNDKKLGGILIEYFGDVAGGCQVVVGVGINGALSTNDQEKIDKPVIDLKQITKGDFLRNQLVADLIYSLSSNLVVYQQNGLKAFMSEFSKLDWLAGKKIKLNQLNKIVTGDYHGISEQGLLQLQESGIIKQYAGGDVSVLL